MKLIDAINMTDTLKPNMYGMQEKIKWLSRLDTRIFQDVLLTHELSDAEKARFLPENTGTATTDDLATWALDLTPGESENEEHLVFTGYTEEDGDTELIVGEPYDDMYVLWISAQIDWNNMEYDNFNASNAMFESVYRNFANAFNATHKPKSARKTYF